MHGGPGRRRMFFRRRLWGLRVLLRRQLVLGRQEGNGDRLLEGLDEAGTPGRR
ncbi:MAG: hypothetical protein MZU95_17635 [Desulfomicrobium escambiense]|nr:hypothetical protein [Desulfomicrobium escambiense]